MYLCIRHALFQSVMTDFGNKAEFITVCLNGNTSNGLQPTGR